MKFDDVWPEGGENQDHEAGEKPMVPDGRHTGEIVDAKEKRFKFLANDANPEGRGIEITIDVPKYQLLEAIVPANFRGKVEAVARAAGVPLPVRGQDWDERCLISRVVTLDTVLTVSKAGRTYVRIDRWHPSPSQPLPDAVVERKPPARSQTAKASREFTSNSPAPDDIPF